MANWPPSLKPIGKYLARAKEVQATSPLVAYYCRYYSLLRAIELRDTSDAAANQFVTALLERCETDKSAIGFDDGTHRIQLEQHALQLFYQADDEDRAGEATRKTATNFYAAMCFLEVCSLFGTLADDLDEKLRYAKWKAADIIKALREGRRPQPASSVEQQQNHVAAKQSTPASPPSSEPIDAQPSLQSRSEHTSPVPPAPPLREYDSSPGEYEASAPPPPPPPQLAEMQLPNQAPPYPSCDEPLSLYPTPSDVKDEAPKAPPIPSLKLPQRERKASAFVPAPTRPLPNTPVSATVSAASITPPSATSTDTEPAAQRQYKPNVKQTQEAQRLCKYAASALDFEDVSTAVSNLQHALQLLTGSR